MNIVIHNYQAGSFLLEREPDLWDAIVILDSKTSPTGFVGENARRHIYLQFDDVVFESDNKRLAVRDDIEHAIAFSAESDNLLVCCRAGQSRSAAIAFLICCHYSGPEAGLLLLNPKRHIPNAHVVSIGAAVLDDSRIIDMFLQWQANNHHIQLSDYYDDIEREFDELEALGARNRIVNL